MVSGWIPIPIMGEPLLQVFFTNNNYCDVVYDSLHKTRSCRWVSEQSIKIPRWHIFSSEIFHRWSLMKIAHSNDNFYASYGKCRVLNERRSKKIFIAVRHSDNRCVAVKLEEISNKRHSKSAGQVAFDFDSYL